MGSPNRRDTSTDNKGYKHLAKECFDSWRDVTKQAIDQVDYNLCDPSRQDPPFNNQAHSAPPVSLHFPSLFSISFLL